MSEHHLLIVSEYEIEVQHPGCPLILHHYSNDSNVVMTHDCPVEFEIEQVGLREALGLRESEWPPTPGVYEIEFWSEEHKIPWSGSEYSSGLSFVRKQA